MNETLNRPVPRVTPTYVDRHSNSSFGKMPKLLSREEGREDPASSYKSSNLYPIMNLLNSFTHNPSTVNESGDESQVYIKSRSNVSGPLSNSRKSFNSNEFSNSKSNLVRAE
jgi:hypothetical protein